MSGKNQVGIRGILNAYTVRRNIGSCCSIVVGMISAGLCMWLLSAKDEIFIYALLEKQINVLIDILPGMLGFCIGGYAIIVAINSLEKMPAIIKPQEKGGMSFYQKVSADFAFTLVVMCLLLLAVFFMRFIMDCSINACCAIAGKIVNVFAIFILLWVGVLTLIMLIGTVANLFSTSIILQVAASVISGSVKEDNEGKKDSPELEIYKVDSWLGSFTVTRFKKP